MASLLMSVALALGVAFSLSAAEEQTLPELEAAAAQEDEFMAGETFNEPGRWSSVGAKIVDASGAVSDAIVRRNRPPLQQQRHSMLEPDGPLSLATTDELLNSVLSHLSVEPEAWQLQQQYQEERQPNQLMPTVQTVESRGRLEHRPDRVGGESHHGHQGSVESDRFIEELSDLAAINHREAEEHRIFVQTSVYILFIMMLLGSACFAGYVAAKNEEKEDSWLLNGDWGGLIGHRNIEVMLHHSKDMARLSEYKKSIKRPDVSGLLYKPGLATRVW